MKSERLQDTLLGLYKNYTVYVSPNELKNEFSSAIQELGEDISVLESSGKIIERLKQYAEAKIGKFIEALNIAFLSEISSKCVEEIYLKGEIKFSDLCLSKNPEYDEIQKILRDIYVLVEYNQKYREMSHHYIGVVKHALSYVKSCDKAFEGFVNNFNGIEKKDKKSTYEYISLDLKSCCRVLENLRNDLTSVGEVISSRHNLLMRTESSIRLLSKYAEVDNFGNRGQSRNHTTGKGGGFSLEKEE